MSRNLSWFKRGIQWDAKFSGFKTDLKYKVPTRCWNRITVFVYENDRQEAVRKVIEEAGKFGYTDVTVDHMVRVG